MHILELLESRWNSREYKLDYSTRHGHYPNETINSWEKRFVEYWKIAPDFAKEFMRNNTDTLVVTDTRGVDSPMYYIFGSTESAYMGLEDDYRSWYYSDKSKKKPTKFKEALFEHPQKSKNLLKNLQIEEATEFMNYLGLKKVMIDIIFCGKVRNLQDILSRCINYGWKLGEATTLEGTKHIFISLYLNPYN
jgi:hypothetical protein